MCEWRSPKSSTVCICRMLHELSALARRGVGAVTLEYVGRAAVPVVWDGRKPPQFSGALETEPAVHPGGSRSTPLATRAALGTSERSHAAAAVITGTAHRKVRLDAPDQPLPASFVAVGSECYGVLLICRYL